MALDTDTFRQALSRFASGVTIVTTLGDDGRPWGFTASAFSSLSLDPPLILVCLANTAECHPHFATTDSFAVNILRHEHRPLAELFAARGADKFGGEDFVDGDDGLPTLPDALAVLSCNVYQRLEAGDHTILIGEVYAAEARKGQPMLHFDRIFHRLTPAAG